MFRPIKQLVVFLIAYSYDIIVTFFFIIKETGLSTSYPLHVDLP